MTHEELQKVAYQCDESGDFTPLEKALVDFFSTADDAEAVWTAVSLDVIGDVAFGDGQLPSSVIDALIDRSLQRGDAAMLGAAVRLASYDPAPTLGGPDSVEPTAASPWFDAAPRLRAAWDGAPTALGVQLLHGLAVGNALDDVDRARLDALLADTTLDDEALGLALVVRAGVKSSVDPSTFRDHASDLVQCAAAMSLARLGEALAGRAVEVLHEALVRPTVTPSWWGFRTYEAVETTDQLTLRALANTHIAEPGPLVRAIVGRSEAGWLEAELLLQLAFPGELDPLGIVAAELDATQRVAVEALGRPPFADLPGALHPLGLTRSADVAPFLAETGPLWSTRPVATSGGMRRWSKVRIWKARVWDVLTADQTRQALRDPLEPAALLELACTRWREALLQSVGRSRGDEHRQRDHEFLIDVLKAIDASDFDLAEATRTRLSDPTASDPVALTVAALVTLASHDLELTTEMWETVADGVLDVEHLPLFVALLDALPESARQSIRDASP